MKKCFEGISRLEFTPSKKINAMISSEDEIVSFVRQIIPKDANGLVEKWLQQVEEIMRLSLKLEASKAIEAYNNMSRKEWMTSYPGQILLACNNVYWTTDVTKVSLFRNVISRCGGLIKIYSIGYRK